MIFDRSKVLLTSFIILVFHFCMVTNITNAQIGYEIRMNEPDELDSFGRIICDDNGNAYCAYHRIPKEDSSVVYPSSVLYKLSSSGDTIALRYNKVDTTIYYNVACFDYTGNIIVEGSSYAIDSNGNQHQKFQFFMKVNPNLQILWEKTFHLESDSFLTWKTETAEIHNNKILSVSTIQNVNTYDLFMRAFIIDENGDSLYYMIFEPEQYGLISSILIDSMNNTIDFHMERASTMGGNSEVKKMVLDTNLGFISINPYPIDDFDGPFNTISYTNNSILSGGYYYDSQQEKDFISAIVMDQSLNLIHEIILCDGEKETYPAWSRCVDYHYTNRIFIAGMYNYTGTFPNEPNWIYLASLNENLDLLYEEYWGGDASYRIFTISATPDGGVILAGDVYDHLSYSNQYDGFLIKFDSMFFVGVDPPYDQNSSLTNIRVRATCGGIDVDSNIDNAIFSLYNLTGKCQLNSKIEIGTNTIINENLKSGIYIWMINIDNEQITGKLHIN